ncbi:MAG: FAD-binding oxidoreductase [Gemmatimonadota bacterium]|nr:FAD-binding oxidoreductase [Gemmatimonadota bacterium]
MKRAAVAVVGGGVIGASIAYHLARRGVRDILVLDRGREPGEGSTGKATGGFRAQFATSVNVRLSLLARAKLRDFGDEIGVDPGYVEAGYLWIASTPPAMEELRAALAIQKSAGLSEAAEIDADGIGRINPAVDLNAVIGGAWCPTDGFISPMQMLNGYIGAATRLGVRFEWDVEVSEILIETKRDTRRLITSRGPVSVDAVVNAAGAWAGMIPCGDPGELTVKPLKRQVALSEATDLLPASMPMTIFVESGFHLRVRNGRVTLVSPTPEAGNNSLESGVDDEWLDSVLAAAVVRVPALADLRLDRRECYAGYYEMSPDRHAILGPAPWCDNLFLANGSSGHGVMHAPAIGQLLAEFICDGVASSLDVSALRPTRFSERAPNVSTELL